jgi:hypothetical protein
MQTQPRQRFLNQGSEAVWHRRPQPGGFEPGPSRYRDSETTLVGLRIQLEAQRRAALFYPEVAGGAVFDGEPPFPTTGITSRPQGAQSAPGTMAVAAHVVSCEIFFEQRRKGEIDGTEGPLKDEGCRSGVVRRIGRHTACHKKSPASPGFSSKLISTSACEQPGPSD